MWGQQFHPFAAAATAGRLLRLSAEEMDVAFGVTATYATVPSVYKYFGPVEDTRPMREVKQGWGWVCMAGLMAAMSAERGFQGGLGALDGEFGFWSMAGSDRFEPERIVDGLGEDWLTREVEFKLHPSIGINHPAYVATQRPRRRARRRPRGWSSASRSRRRGANLIGDLAPAEARSTRSSRFRTRSPRRSPACREGPSCTQTRSSPIRPSSACSPARGIVHDHEADRAFFEEQRIVQRVEIELAGGADGLAERSSSPATGLPRAGPRSRRSSTSSAAACSTTSAAPEWWRPVGGLEELDDVAELAALLAPGGRARSAAP